MIENEIELEGNPQFTQGLQVSGGCQHLVQVVVNDRKAAVEIGVEHTGQNVESLEDILQFRPVQKQDDVAQGAPHAVGVGVEHRTGRECFSSCLFHLTSPDPSCMALR